MPRIYDFTGYMDAHKAVAAARRHRGQATGKAARGHTRKRSDVAPAPERGSFAELVVRTNAHWNATCINAVEQFRFDINGGWEGFV